MTPENKNEFEILEAEVGQLEQSLARRRDQLQKAQADLLIANNELREQQHFAAQGKEANPHKAQEKVNGIQHLIAGLESLMAQARTEIAAAEPRRRILTIMNMRAMLGEEMKGLEKVRDEAKAKLDAAAEIAAAAQREYSKALIEIRSASARHEDHLSRAGA